jgi:hypothetical protein
MYYCATASETVILPTDIVFSNEDKYDSWWQVANCKKGAGHLRFYTSSGLQSCTVQMTMKNKLWYINHDSNSNMYRQKMNQANDAFIASVNGTMLRTLWHHRLCHAGQ